MPAPEIAILLDLIDQAYDVPAWHGPNLKASIRRVKPHQAAWRPSPERHSIAEIVVHAAYWKYAVRRQLRNDARGSFPLKGSNWFVLPDPLTAADWARALAILEDEHGTLREAVAGLDPSHLHDPSPKKKYRMIDLIQGVAAHDVYHAGQIQILKRLLPGE